MIYKGFTEPTRRVADTCCVDENGDDDKKARILVVEDEEAIRRGLCDVLAYHGHAPIAAENGERGLELATGGDFALLLLDLMLPGLSGLEICRRLKADSSLRATISAS